MIETIETKRPDCCEPVASKISHPSHRAVLSRLKRTEGQVRGIINMIETDRYCVDILVQTRALIAALKAAEKEILDRHIQNCVSGAIESKDLDQTKVKLQELVTLIQRMG